MTKHRKSVEIISTNYCCYGCGNIVRFRSPRGIEMCDSSPNKCPANKKKNQVGLELAYSTGKRTPAKVLYNELSENIKQRMAWSKGKTQETDSRVARPERKGIRFGASLYGHTDEAKRKISTARTEWLKKSENRKNLGRHHRSWMELQFEKYLTENNVTGWETEKHFWSDELKKNFYPDFLFEDLKLIVELDGTQHEKTIELDTIRDNWFNSIGYSVVRIKVSEFKKRLFSQEGFLDIICVHSK